MSKVLNRTLKWPMYKKTVYKLILNCLNAMKHHYLYKFIILEPYFQLSIYHNSNNHRTNIEIDRLTDGRLWYL